jgi:hypothetical protein
MSDAQKGIVTLADLGIPVPSREYMINQQLLCARSFDPSSQQNSLAPVRSGFSRLVKPSASVEPLDLFETAEPSGTRITLLGPSEVPPRHSPPRDPRTRASYPDLILCGNQKLDRIMTFLAPRPNEYELSDWEDEDAMKTQEFDLDASESSGKQFPDWACGENLERAVAHQDPTDGDTLFHTMARRCNLIDLFGTTHFRYYQKRGA